MRQIINGMKYWGQLLLLPIYWLSFLFPRNKNIWLFGSTFGRRFADNPRYFYLYVGQLSSEKGNPKADGCKGVRPIWISHSKELVDMLCKKGYEAYYHHSPKGIWYCLRGSVYLFDNYAKDISFWLSGGAVKINLWHGIPLKKIQHDNVFDRFRHPSSIRERIHNYPRNLSDEKPHHYVLTTSSFMEPIFSSAFQTENVLLCGYPRCDNLAGHLIENALTQLEEHTVHEIKKQIKKYSDSKMIYYVPTFRDSETEFFRVMDLEKFREFLERQHITFCVKLHPKSKLREEFDGIKGEQILVIDADTDPYVFIEMADILITDYSSIYFDYLLTNRPILFFNYDLDMYLKDSREMYFDYDAFTPGRKASNQEELEQAICQTISEKKGSDSFLQERTELKKKIFNDVCVSASEKLTEQIHEILEG